MPTEGPKVIETSGATKVEVVGLVQGLVIGDHNTVSQTYNVTRHDSYRAEEYQPLPPHWVERPEITARTAKALNPGSVVALCGMGGSGKSALAGRVVSEVAPAFPAGNFWIDMAAGGTDDALLRIALSFGHDISNLPSRDARSKTVRSLLGGKAVLLVLDDVWTPEELAAFLPQPPSCGVLLTTRNDAIAASVADEVVQVEELSAADAVTLLAAVSGAPATEPALGAVAGSLAGLPLAIELAGKLARQQARRPGFSWANFAAGFADSCDRLSVGLAGKSVRAAFDTTWTRALDDETRHGFAILGIFSPGDISTAEVAAAWNADDKAAVSQLNKLIDLSLLRQLDSVTLRLHPLLADYAKEMANHLAQEELTAAHCRVADHLYNAAVRPPRTVTEMATVLRSHYHAALAGDKERAKRVYPWFDQIAVPGFLIDHGQLQTRVLHERLQLELSKDLPPWSRSFAYFRLGEALQMAGELKEAEETLNSAVNLMEGPDVDHDGRAIGLTKFLMALGQVQAALGKLADAEATYKRAVAKDREFEAAGKVAGARGGALIDLLQLSDVLAASTPDKVAEAERICCEVYNEAVEHRDAGIAVMALARLAHHLQPADPVQSLTLVRTAEEIGKTAPDAFAGRQGARYARSLAATAVNLAFNGQPAADIAIALLCRAIAEAGRCDARQELGQALYQLGNLFEHFFLVGRDTPFGAAWACYKLSDSYTKENEQGNPLNAEIRINERLIPRMDEKVRAAAAEAVATDPWGAIEAAVSPCSIGWRPNT